MDLWVFGRRIFYLPRHNEKTWGWREEDPNVTGITPNRHPK